MISKCVIFVISYDYQQSLGPNHIDFTASLNNLGLLYDETGKHNKAVKIFEKSLEVRKLSVPGEDHILTSLRFV